ncbi:D-arabinono-1,4-lactone oxidase [Sporosarcina limicola]|uniref:FAD-linked oxidoreductase n=1 Tax=Sporosarcina limicola TaxID=34101 RepID=A0A927MFY8_9BACL|nr:D-arabinono-1,4-lactone oxidase [Sporosarcina limicola]MBE1553880.1 FAD-linked oxidoreductase [Sporosarcina limicola]
MSIPIKGMKWSNWAQNVIAQPDYFHYPESVSDIQDTIDSCRIRGASLRVTGAAHSFSPVASPDHDAMSLDNLRGLISYNSEAMEARIWAGTYLHEAARILASIDMAFENMGDIQEQTIAGAVSTGTHGTGITFGSLSDQVIAWTWIDGKGQVRHHRRANDDLSKALSLSLGMLGVLVDVTLRTVPLYSLRVKSTRSGFDEALTAWTSGIHTNRHMEWFYFPGTNTVQVKETNTIPLAKQRFQSKTKNFVKNGIIETVGFKALSELCRVKPKLSRKLTNFSAKNVPNGSKEGLYYEVFSSPRLVKFTETEYAIPLHAFETCIMEIHEFLRAHPFYVHFPIECRVTAGEDAFLSPTQGVETAFLAFHMYKGMDDGPYFKWVHKLMEKYNGRPHFGKLNDLTNEKLTTSYPNVDRFLKIREKYDPNGIFMSQYMKQLFLP